MLQARRDKAVLKAADKGVKEPKPKEIDVWPIVLECLFVDQGEDFQRSRRRKNESF